MRVLSILMALAVALGVYLWLALGAAPDRSAETTTDAAPVAAAAIEVVATRSRAQVLPRVFALRGVAEAARNVSVKAQTEGLVVSTPKRKGELVRAGELLCEIETGDREAELARARALLAQATADARASGTLAERGFSAEVTVAADEAALEAARAEVTAMELDLARTQIRAPFTGRLESDAAETGALLQNGDVCATLIDLDPIRLVGFAPEAEIFDLDVGAPVAARLLDGTEITAQLTFVARSADPDTRTFRVEAGASNEDERIRDGATVLMAIQRDAIPAHRLPHSALTLDDAGRLGVRLVASSEDLSAPDAPAPDRLEGRAAFAPISVLRDDADGIWVAGLPARADVILVGQEFVGDGAAIIARFDAAAAARAPDATAARAQNPVQEGAVE